MRVELYGHLDMKGLMYSAKTVDLEKTKLMQCEKHVRDWKEQSKKVCYNSVCVCWGGGGGHFMFYKGDGCQNCSQSRILNHKGNFDKVVIVPKLF